MSGYMIGNFLIYAVINAFTPGPGNILALNTVGSYGWKKGKPLFFGIFTGYYIVQILCAAFVFGVSSFLPHVLGVMKYIGAGALLQKVYQRYYRPINIVLALLLGECVYSILK